MQKVVNFAIILSFVVVLLGAFTRLSDAGLGCPDWPYCYGHMVLPKTLEKAQIYYPDIPLESKKAWTEMIHRYVAGTLGLVIFIIGFLGFRTKHWKIPVILMGLVLFQALLGMWTVTMKLMPLIVLSHLIGGMMIFSLLCLLRFKLSSKKPILTRPLSFFIKLGFVILILQIILGGWVSSNYAGLSCIGFPQCNGQWLPMMNLSQGFNLHHIFNQMGLNHQGGILDIDARIAIQYVHRIGALITALYLLILSYFILQEKDKDLRLLAMIIAFLILLQFSLGIVNVVYLLPISVAVAHNGTATLLLASMILLVFGAKKGAIHGQ